MYAQWLCREMTSTSSLALTTTQSKCGTCRPKQNFITSKTLIQVLSIFISFSSHCNLGGILSVTVSRDNTHIISGSWDRSIKVWDMDTKAELHHFKDAHSCTYSPSSSFHDFLSYHSLLDWVNSVTVSRDNKYIISGSADNSIKIFLSPNSRIGIFILFHPLHSFILL